MTDVRKGLENFINDSLSYLSEETRRRTFKKWMFTNKEACNADKMAEAGFIYTGNKREPDSVKCFFCRKSLDGWEATDDPWKEHLSHASECTFAKLQTAQDNITVETFLDLKQELVQKCIDFYMDTLVEEVEESMRNIYVEGCKIIDRQ